MSAFKTTHRLTSARSPSAAPSRRLGSFPRWVFSIWIAAAIAVVALAGSRSAVAAEHSAAQGRTPIAAHEQALPLFFSESWRHSSGGPVEAAVTQSNVASQNLELKLFGLDAKDLEISGEPGPNNYLNVWSGLSKEPFVVLLRDKNRYVDLSGVARIRWRIRTAGFHQVRPAIQLADGTLLVGDHADSSTIFAEREFAIADIRWIRLDPNRVVTLPNKGSKGETGSWYPNPDLSKVDAVGWVDLMPGSGHGFSGWINMASIEVYGKPIER